MQLQCRSRLSTISREITLSMVAQRSPCAFIAHTRLPLHIIDAAAIDPSFVITHRMPLAEAPRGYQIFRDKEEQCFKVVLRP